MQNFTFEELFLFSRYLSFCLDFLVMYKNDLIRKVRLFSKFMTSQPGSQEIPTDILINISRSKDNQSMKFGQLTEYNRKILFGKSYIKCGGKTIPTPFSKKSNLRISLDQQPKTSYSLFLLYVKSRNIEIYRVSCTPLAFTLYKTFLKNKTTSGTSLPSLFFA